MISPNPNPETLPNSQHSLTWQGQLKRKRATPGFTVPWSSGPIGPQLREKKKSRLSPALAWLIFLSRNFPLLRMTDKGSTHSLVVAGAGRGMVEILYLF